MVTSSENVKFVLLELGIPAHLAGYKNLCAAISLYDKADPQPFVKELYPSVAKVAGSTDWRAAEASMRKAITDGWELGNQLSWKTYFPSSAKPPTVKKFISTIAEYI